MATSGCTARSFHFQVAIKKCKQTSCNIAVLSGAADNNNQFLQLSPPTASAGYYMMS